MEQINILNGYEIADKKARDIVDSFVTPQMFGAVGDGVTDDTQAFQDALDTGVSVFIPLINGNRYLITDTLYLRNQRQCVYGDIPIHDWSFFTTDTEYHRGCIAFDTTEQDKPLFHAISVMNGFTNISCRSVNPNTGDGIHYEKESDLTNVDGTVKECSFRDFNNAIIYVGRGLSVINNVFVSCFNDIVVELPIDEAWEGSTDETILHQTHPALMGRALRVINNRHHINKNRLLKVTTTPYDYDGTTYITALKGALISGNISDLGRGSYEFDCNVEDCIISNNIINRCQMTTAFRFIHEVKTTTICDNNVKGDLNDLVTPYTPTNFLRAEKVLYSNISNNNVSNIKGSCIYLLHNGQFSHNSVNGNVFYNVGYDATITDYQRSAIIISNADNNIISNNVFNETLSKKGCCVRPINDDGVWSDNTIVNNVLPYGVEAIFAPANNSTRNKIENNMDTGSDV